MTENNETASALNQITFGNALITDIEFNDGKQTQLITIFNNNEFHFEEVKISVDYLISRINRFYPNKIKKIQSSFNVIRDGKLKRGTIYKMQEL